MKIEIATVEKVTYKNDRAASVTIPTTTGEITVLEHHIPLISLLASGVLTVVREDGKSDLVAVSGGMFEVRKTHEGENGGETKIIVLADVADTSSELDYKKVEEAKQRAEMAVRESKSSTITEEEYRKLLADLSAEEARLKAAARAGNIS